VDHAWSCRGPRRSRRGTAARPAAGTECEQQRPAAGAVDTRAAGVAGFCGPALGGDVTGSGRLGGGARHAVSSRGGAAVRAPGDRASGAAVSHDATAAGGSAGPRGSIRRFSGEWTYCYSTDGGSGTCRSQPTSADARGDTCSVEPGASAAAGFGAIRRGVAGRSGRARTGRAIREFDGVPAL